MSRIPEILVKRGLKLASEGKFHGVVISELSHDEAIAAAAIMGKAYNDQIKESVSAIDALSRLQRAVRR